jgi:hypothetical protein
MSRETNSFDVRSNPELARLAGQVRASKRPLFLRDAEETVAVLMPVSHPKPPRRRTPTEADYQAFLSSFGAWKGIVDAEQLKRDIAASRGIAPRPRPEL